MSPWRAHRAWELYDTPDLRPRLLICRPDGLEVSIMYYEHIVSYILTISCNVNGCFILYLKMVG